jgi:hypothetical protein
MNTMQIWYQHIANTKSSKEFKKAANKELPSTSYEAHVDSLTTRYWRENNYNNHCISFAQKKMCIVWPLDIILNVHKANLLSLHEPLKMILYDRNM